MGTPSDRKSIDNFFRRVNNVIKQKCFPIESYQMNLFKSLCVYDYMQGPCDWDESLKVVTKEEPSEIGEGKETYPFFMLTEMLDPTYCDGFYCDQCDDFGPDTMCEHKKQNVCDRLEEFMVICADNLNTAALTFSHLNQVDKFHLPPLMSFGTWFGEEKIDTEKLRERDLQSQYFLSCTKELFDHREMDYDMFLSDLRHRYSNDVNNLA